VGRHAEVAPPLTHVRRIDVTTVLGPARPRAVANAAGSFGGGLVIDLGFGWTAPAVLGAVLAAAGLAVVAAAALGGRAHHVIAASAGSAGCGPR